MEGWTSARYGDAFADVYDDWYAAIPDLDAAVRGLAALAGSGPVLELGVGTGRLALPLAATGLEVHGVDTSGAMLDRLRAKPGADGITLTVGDMATDLPAGPYRLVYVAYNTFFNLLTAEAQQACFDAVATRLDPAGSFAVEAFVPDDPPRSGTSVEVRDLTSDRVVLSVTRYDAGAQTAEGQFVELTESAGVRLRPWAIRWATPAELDAMAARAGLGLAQRWRDWTGSPWTGDSDHHVSVFTRAPSGATAGVGSAHR